MRHRLYFFSGIVVAMPAFAGVTATSSVLTGTADGAFGDPSAAVGPISADSTYGGLNPYNPAFAPSQIIRLNPGNSLTVQLSAPLLANGPNLGIYSSVGLLDQSQDGSGLAGNPPVILDPTFFQSIVSVSQDGTHFVALNGGNPIAFSNPTNAYLDASITNDYQSLGTFQSDMFKPFLGSLNDLSGEDYAANKATLDGSAGGTWLDLSGTGLTSVTAIRFDVPAGAGYTAVIDAVAGTPVVPKIVVNGGAQYTVGSNGGPGIKIVYVAGMQLSAGATVTVPPAANHANRSVLNILDTDAMSDGSLTFAGAGQNLSGTIDLSNNDAIVAVTPANADTTSFTTIDNLAAAMNAVAMGYNHGHWNGAAGIVSSTAAADTSHLTAIGVVQNNQSGGPLYYSFDGDVPGPDDLLFKFTWYGDANLDGKVDGSDYSLIDAGFASNGSLTGWYNGDFNYDGVVDGSDYSLIDNAYNNQAVDLSAAALVAATTARIAVVPEPAAIAFACALLPFLRRTDRRKM